MTNALAGPTCQRAALFARAYLLRIFPCRYLMLGATISHLSSIAQDAGCPVAIPGSMSEVEST
jgi:hypothetical protein